MKTYPEKTIVCSAKFRIYPNKDIKEKIEKNFFAYRYLYNRTLDHLIKTKPNPTTLSLKSCFDFLRKNEQIQSKKIDLTDYSLSGGVVQAYRYYKTIKPDMKPIFLGKYSRKKKFFVQIESENLLFRNRRKEVYIPGYGYVECRGVPNKVNGKLNLLFIQKNDIGEYYLNAQIEHRYKPMTLKREKSPIGIDVSLKYFSVFDDGTKLSDIKITEKELRNIANKQRQLASKVKHSKNYEKALLKFRKAFYKACNRKKDKIHKITYRLIKEHSFIATETLDLKEIRSEHSFASAFQKNNFSHFFQCLEYKSKWNERALVKVDRFYPSTKICSSCGYVNHEINDVSIHEWTCPECGKHHDRDVNAACNILNEGKRIYMKKIQT